MIGGKDSRSGELVKWRIGWPDLIAGTGVLVIWVSLALWAAGIRPPDKTLLLGVAMPLVAPAAGVRITRLLRSTLPSSPSSSGPSSPPSQPSPDLED